jgi:hypothetical protein
LQTFVKCEGFAAVKAFELLHVLCFMTFQTVRSCGDKIAGLALESSFFFVVIFTFVNFQCKI